MPKKKVLILSYSRIDSDPRVQRQIKALSENFHVEVSGYSISGNENIPFYPIYSIPPFSIQRKLKRLYQFITGQFDRYYWDSGKTGLLEKLKPKNYDAIIANDIHTLPLALSIADGKPKVYFDAHEYHPLEFEDNFKWRIFHKPFIEYLCKKYIPHAAAFSTVCEGIAKEYHKFCGRTPVVITNAAYYSDLQPSKTEKGKIKLIHHGAAIPGRQIENMISIMKNLDQNFSLYLMLTDKGGAYYNQLVKYASEYKNVFFIDPVPFKEIVKNINKYDIGLYCLPPGNFNNRYALPNKFFEFIQAKLAVVVSPNEEMANLVVKHKIGLVAKNFSPESMAETLMKLDIEQINIFKNQTHMAAKVLSAEENMLKINSIVSALTSK